MAVSYFLQKSNLSGAPEGYVAHVRLSHSVNLEGLVERVAAAGSTVTRADILAVLEDAVKECEAVLAEGGRVNLGGLCQLFPRIRGVFDGPDDAFDPKRHRVDAAAAPGTRLRKTLRQKATPERIAPPRPAPLPELYRDLASGTDNSRLTPGGIGEIVGALMKFDPAALDEGVFLTPSGGGAETRVSQVLTAQPKKVVLQMPAGLAAGEWRLEVRARARPGAQLRTGALAKTLLVE